jgi:RNA polymerase sigma-70 factor, ECF subfamily
MSGPSSSMPDSPGGAGDDDRTDPLGQLLRRSARGDEQAFAKVYDALAARGYGLALRVVRDPAQAEEVVQEAFLDVWRTASRFDPARGSATSWVLTIVHRKAVDRVRAAEAAGRRETTYGRAEQDVAHDSTAEAAQASLEARRVRQALAALTPVQQEAIRLSYFAGYTHTEVAGLLDLPLGTAKTRIRDGLIRLRDQMGVGGESDD